MLSLISVPSKLSSEALSQSVLVAIINLVSSFHTSPSEKEASLQKAATLARKYTTTEKYAPAGRHACVWIARMNAEQALHESSASTMKSESQEAAAREDLMRLWRDAQDNAIGEIEAVEEVWLWGLPSSPLLMEDAADNVEIDANSGGNGRTSIQRPSDILGKLDGLGSVFNVSCTSNGVQWFIRDAAVSDTFDDFLWSDFFSSLLCPSHSGLTTPQNSHIVTCIRIHR